MDRITLERHVARGCWRVIMCLALLALILAAVYCAQTGIIDRGPW